MPFNFDMTEILVLAVLAVIIFGPEKLPELARKTGRVLNYVRNIANDAKGQLGKELGPEFENLNLNDLNPKALVNKHLLNPVQSTIEPVKAELAPVKATLAASAAGVAATQPGAAAVASGSVVPDAVVARTEPLVAARATVPFDPEAT